MMAAGELPDLVCFHNHNQASDAIKANLLTPLDSYLSKMPNVSKNGATSLAYFRDTLGGGKTYLIGQGIGKTVFTGGFNYSVNLRWDLYKKIGKPALNSMDDLIPMLQAMQKIEPTTPDGKKVYGFSLWPDWDGDSTLMSVAYTGFYGVETWDAYAEYDSVTGKTVNQLSDESMYKKALAFLFRANQAGLMDPDSITQRFENARAKFKDGRTLFAPWSWVGNVAYNTAAGADGKTNEDSGKGYVSMFPKNMKTHLEQSSPIGYYPWAIGKTKKLDDALKFLDFWFSVESSSIIANGMEGTDWVMKDGVPTITEKGIADMDSGAHAKAMAFYTHPGLLSGFYNDKTGFPIGRGFWPQVLNRAPTSKIEQDYYANMGISNIFDGFDLKTHSSKRIAYNLKPVMDDDTKALISKISPIVKTASWQMIFAKSEAEFESIWKDMQAKANGLGLDKVYKTGIDILQETFKRTQKYGDPEVIVVLKGKTSIYKH